LADLDHPEVHYPRTGLKTVVCQVRFNPILKIGQQLPAEFQDLVRHAFPQFFQEESAEFRIAPGALEAVPSTSLVWRFRSDDGSWTAGLASGSLSLETTQYRDFGDFESRFRIVEQALESVYGLDHYVRVGLRYINIFTPDEFPGRWSDKFNPTLVGPMADPILGSKVRESRQAFILAHEDWTIRVSHGTENDHYRLDIDHATEVRVDAKDVLERLRDFNGRIYQVFRWAISDELRGEMEGKAHE
ncbi:MAG: TIGR04255 family protein, partial [Dehalococcoidia bacterium]|nr:TIGR04255 family protein [Dehalococcoidia bacterium]